MHEFRLRVGDAVIGLTCPSAEYSASLAAYFGGGTDGAPHIRLRLEIVPHRDHPAIPNSLFTTKRLCAGESGAFDIAGGLVEGRYDPVAREGELRVKCVLTNNQMTRVFEQLLYQAFYSAAEAAGQDACLIHAAGVVRDGAGYLFVGAPGAGKSTAARLSAEMGLPVLNDEICLVRFGGAEAAGSATAGGEKRGAPASPLLCSTPFNGLFADKTTGSAPLRAVLLLAQAPHHRLSPVGRGAAVAAVAGQVVPPAGLDRLIDGSARTRLLADADRLCAAAPALRLEFLPDAGFWREIDRAFGGDSAAP